MRVVRYRADPPSSRRAVALDATLTAIFHRPSAATHVVCAPVPEILDALAGGAASAAEIMSLLEKRFELEVFGGSPATRVERSDAGSQPSPENGMIEISARLEELVAAGLVTHE